MKIYIMRHGQTEWNVKKIIQGQKDIPLNKKGIEQAKNVINEFNDYGFDLIISSPLKRTKQTAEILNIKNIPIIYDERLIERGLGELEGTSFSLEGNDIYNVKLNLKIKNIEPVIDLFNRINELMEDIKRNYFNKKVLLITHSGTARAIESYFLGLSNNGDMAPETLKNCEIREYEFK